jgi:ribosome-binding factor A
MPQGIRDLRSDCQLQDGRWCVMGNRQKRLGELLKHEISDMLLRGIKDPRIGFVSVTSVELTADLRQAKVFVSVLGSELGQRLRLKYLPEIIIEYDTSIEQGARILALIDSVVQKKTDTPDEE